MNTGSGDRKTINAFLVIGEEHKGKITEQPIRDWAKKEMAGYKWPRVAGLGKGKR